MNNKILPVLFFLVIIFGAVYIFTNKNTNPSKIISDSEVKTIVSETNSQTPIPETSNNLSQPNQESGNVSQGLTFTVADPKNEAVVNTPTIQVKGSTVPNAQVFVNDKGFSADAAGNFATTITLDEGENTIIIVINDDNGNFAEQDLTVTLETID